MYIDVHDLSARRRQQSGTNLLGANLNKGAKATLASRSEVRSRIAAHKPKCEGYKAQIILILFLLLIASIFPCTYTAAKDLGVIGPTYPIAEKDFLELIQERLKNLQQSGKLAALQKQLQVRAKQYADRPTPLSNITRTKKTRTWIFDPSIKLAHDLNDQNGIAFAKAGTVINPLQISALHETLIFYNADDSLQVTLVKKLAKQFSPNKLILTGGSVLSQTKIFKQPIYFDQQGHLTKHFHLTHVPALVQQEGLRLKISEVVP